VNTMTVTLTFDLLTSNTFNRLLDNFGHLSTNYASVGLGTVEFWVLDFGQAPDRQTDRLRDAIRNAAFLREGRVRI